MITQAESAPVSEEISRAGYLYLDTVARLIEKDAGITNSFSQIAVSHGGIDMPEITVQRSEGFDDQNLCRFIVIGIAYNNAFMSIVAQLSTNPDSTGKERISAYQDMYDTARVETIELDRQLGDADLLDVASALYQRSATHPFVAQSKYI